MLKSASSNIRIGKSQWSVMFLGNGKANKIILILIIIIIITAQRTNYCDYGNFFNNTNFYDYLDYTWIVGGPLHRLRLLSLSPSEPGRIASLASPSWMAGGVNYLEGKESQVDASELN